MLQSEAEYVNDLHTFNEVYTLRIQPWLEASTDKDIVAKFKMTSAKDNLDALFENLDGIAKTHASFLKELKERFVVQKKGSLLCSNSLNRVHVWGPTQLISDVFGHLVRCLYNI